MEKFNRNDRGQATVEVALLIPFLALFLLLIVQVALIAREHVLVAQAARSAARELSVNSNHENAITVAQRSAPGARIDISRPSTPGQYLSVTVHETVKSSLPLIGIVFPDVTVSSQVVMRVEK
ncbi:MAG TPA: pilus assembly protein [Acidimicrobiia bacterium]|jgi:Flp pilus assembly protein TadG|nr:pilus assembly protein [Acidimicrobiia bacterium]